jgi:hypothetical protein
MRCEKERSRRKEERGDLSEASVRVLTLLSFYPLSSQSLSSPLLFSPWVVLRTTRRIRRKSVRVVVHIMEDLEDI